MELRTAASPKDVKWYDTKRLREEFLVEKVFKPGEIYLVYSHIDRIIFGSATPTDSKLVLTAGDELRADYFLQRRELGVINIGGAGSITIDGIPSGEFPHHALRRRIGTVPQKAVLFHGTIRQNLQWTHPIPLNSILTAHLLMPHIPQCSSSPTEHPKRAL